MEYDLGVDTFANKWKVAARMSDIWLTNTVKESKETERLYFQIHTKCVENVGNAL